MEELTEYKKPLPTDTSLCVFNKNELIFSVYGKWLMPLFDLEKFLKTYEGDRKCLCIHDTSVGKAAVLLMFRLGITHIHADLISELALTFISELNEKHAPQRHLTVSFNKTVPRLLCQTEAFFEKITDEEFMYKNLCERAKH